ncbi:hypothetical protein ABZ865_39690 [Streptomyces sp. NPDC047085]|uniref:hypothetical protein n=1 Tax=Streptomyces sp. NPDC047085 TaxID=3155140 RepID=UPI00340F9669
MRVRAVAGAVLLAAVSLASCSGEKEGGHKGSSGSALNPFQQAKSLAKLSVPAAYDAREGWDTTLGGVPKRVANTPVAAVPGAGEVASIQGAPNGYTTIVRAADTGRIRWSSAPWNIPTPDDGDDDESQTPGLTVVDQDGREYIVAYAHGVRGKDALHDGTAVVSLAVYAADGHGASVKPLRQIDLRVKGEPMVRVSADGGRVLVGLGGDIDSGMYPEQSIAVDVVTGRSTAYDHPHDLLSPCGQADCAGGRVIAATPDGPLIGVDNGGFGLAGHWFSDSVRPRGTERTGDLAPFNGLAYGVIHGQVLAGWQTPDEENGTAADPVWSVHDLRTGRLQASMTCGYGLNNEINAGNYGSNREYSVVASPDGRYLAAGPVAFDLQSKKGVCLAKSGSRKGLAIVSIRDDGTAYGAVQQDSTADGTEPVTVQVDLNAGPDAARALGSGTTVPFVTSVKGAGLFLSRDNNGALRVSLRRER